MAKFATGKHSTAVCDRCGFRYPYLQIRTEPGTRWRVCRTCNDGIYSLVSHPQNRIPPISDDPQGLQFPRPEVCTGFTAGTTWDNNLTTWWDSSEETEWDGVTTTCPPQAGG